MVIVVSADDAPRARQVLSASGETVFEIGRVEATDDAEAQAVVV